MREERSEEILRPNDGYGWFAVKMLILCAVFIGAAELCGISIERGTNHLLAMRITGTVTAILGLAVFFILVLATYVHVRVCLTLRRLNRERKQSKDSSIPIINQQKHQSNED